MENVSHVIIDKTGTLTSARNEDEPLRSARRAASALRSGACGSCPSVVVCETGDGWASTMDAGHALGLWDGHDPSWIRWTSDDLLDADAADHAVAEATHCRAEADGRMLLALDASIFDVLALRAARKSRRRFVRLLKPDASLGSPIVVCFNMLPRHKEHLVALIKRFDPDAFVAAFVADPTYGATLAEAADLAVAVDPHLTQPKIPRPPGFDDTLGVSAAVVIPSLAGLPRLVG
ncbi:uncharacterized protein AMSG_02667 [Thecamonas trahens ATCC 50062]|uniref:Uncharacterized protein n=1 Tax=Thecamonas trahens ATCC 50062 TaxID=461836 RepID=A0A0L0D1Y6_THETB|nr:hypothetical protein AMSG_02667 [Thecamonas trahens ATCC 50062]KNC46216.1 hypothetical protein AMSG_02667 [Thecamonas trahens ATCC 50062]|eukprot:XP_013760513.1 hypothetical protein AMSG_02667 [Thecamonas trahens ATCC 50062]